MTKTVWKFSFPITNDIEIEMPADAKILHLDVQRGTPCVWAIVNPERAMVKRTFRLAATGHPLPGDLGLDHIGSFQMQEGTLVFHLFETTTGEVAAWRQRQLPSS